MVQKKNNMKYLKTYNESLRDKMKPKSDEEILKELGDLTPEELLFQSVQNNYIKGVEIALKRGANVNYKNDNGETALMWASHEDYIDIVKILLRNNADINIQDIKGDTALLHASFKGHKKIVYLLIKNGADVNIKNKKRKSILYYTNNKIIINLLKKYGAKE